MIFYSEETSFKTHLKNPNFLNSIVLCTNITLFPQDIKDNNLRQILKLSNIFFPEQCSYVPPVWILV